MGSSPIFRIIKRDLWFYQRFLFIVPKRDLNPWFRSSLRYGRRRAFVHRTNCAPSSASFLFQTLRFCLEILFYTNVQLKPMVQVFASLRSAQNTRPPDEPGPIFRFLTIYAFFYLQDTIQFHLLRSPWRSTERLRTSKLPLCYHFSKTQQEIFPHHTAAYIKSLLDPPCFGLMRWYEVW